MPKNKAINLLPQEEFDASTTGRVLKWATGTFRVIVIVTEMVVMSAFLSRFWLDAQNSDLNNAIKIKSSQIQAQSGLENQFRTIQSKLSIFNQIATSNNDSKLLDEVITKVPSMITLSKVSINPESIDVRGTAISDVAIEQFINNLQSKSFKSVELNQLSTSTDNSGASDFLINILY